MDKYKIKLLRRAYKDIDLIYGYISEEFKAPESAKNMVDSIEVMIFGLEEFPYRGAERKVGVYANKAYRQLFVKNYTVVYRIDEKEKQVVIVTVRYSPSQF